jgi:hypothetical protein
MLENDCGFTFIHCECTRWAKEVKKDLLNDLKKLFELHRCEMFAIHEIGDAKHKKFLKLVGFNYLKDFVGSDKKLRQIFIRRAL